MPPLRPLLAETLCAAAQRVPLCRQIQGLLAQRVTDEWHLEESNRQPKAFGRSKYVILRLVLPPFSLWRSKSRFFGSPGSFLIVWSSTGGKKSKNGSDDAIFWAPLGWHRGSEGRTVHPLYGSRGTSLGTEGRLCAKRGAPGAAQRVVRPTL